MFLDAKDTISGQEGRAYAKIGERNEEMFYVKKIEAIAEKIKKEIKTLGKRGTQNKAAGYKGTGTMTIYYVTSTFRELMAKYINDGIDTYFDITVVNSDPNSAYGGQTVTLNNVNLDKVIMAMLDVDTESLEEEVTFTWEGLNYSEKFQPLG